MCEDNHYVSGSKCAKVVKNIDNCKVYSAADLCSACNANFQLAVDKKSCVKVPSL